MTITVHNTRTRAVNGLRLWDVSTLLAFIYLIANPFFPAAHVLSILLAQFVSGLRAVRIAMMLIFLGSVLAVAFTPFGLLLTSHEFVKLIVMPLSFALLVSAAMLFVPLATAVSFPLLLVTLDLTPTMESPLNKINHLNMTLYINVYTVGFKSNIQHDLRMI